MTLSRSIRTPIMHRLVEVGGLIFVGGTVADDTSAGMRAQTESILNKIEGWLRTLDLDRRAIAQATIFVTDLGQKQEMDAAWTAFFGDDLPTRATVGVSNLGGGALIEVVATATRG